MDGSEVFILIVSIALAVTGIAANTTSRLHRLHFRDNPAPGIVRLGVIVAMAWIGYVLWRHADPSVTGIWIVFYLVMGYAAVKMFGQTVAAAYGARTRVDVGERRNVAAALLIAAFTVATGLIFGGSLWGEADPWGDDDGGWWIPVSFFLLGWASLLVVFALFLRREPGKLRERLRGARSRDDARAAAVFLLGAGWVLGDAVAGDFFGWRHALVTSLWLVGLLIVREAFNVWSSRRPVEDSDDGGGIRIGRLLESAFYLVLAFGSTRIERLIEAWALAP